MSASIDDSESSSNTMSQKPSLKFPAGCNGRAETAAAYRFVDNDKVGKDQVLFPHRTATLERIRAEKVVLIPQDTTELDVTRPHEIMAGAGPLNDESRVGFHDHALLAFTPEGVPLGVVAADIWARDFDGFDKDADQKRAERRAKSIEEKESHRWLDGISRGLPRGPRGARDAHRLSFRQRGRHL